MQQDTLDVPCDGLVIHRTWTAVDVCGNTTISHQTIIVNDTTPPVVVIPLNSIIHDFLSNVDNHVFLSEIDLINLLNALNAGSVLVEDDCSQTIIPVFTVDTTYADNCLEDGYYERRTYTWVATDVCGNSTTVTFSVDIMDNTPPVFSAYPKDITIICEELPAVPVIFADNGAQPITIVFTEVIEPGVGIGVYEVTRTWTATDACGNVTVYVQHIKWIPDTFLDCNIILPPTVNCNTHGIVINSSYTGGNGPLTYNWEIVGEDCFIQGGQGTPKITVYVGWSDVKIILTVTDAFGCVSMCMITQSCEFSVDNAFSGLPPTTDNGSSANEGFSKPTVAPISIWPNPANGSVNLGYESALEGEVEFSFTNLLGQVVLSGKMAAIQGLNTHKVDVSQIQEGSYMVQVKTEKHVYSKVLVVMHSN